MPDVEYRARIQKSYVVTRYEEGVGSITCGTYPTREQAETACRMFAIASGGRYLPIGYEALGKPIGELPAPAAPAPSISFLKRPIVVEACRWNGCTIGLTNGGTSIADEVETGVLATERLVKPDWMPTVSDVREHDPHGEMPAPFVPVGEIHRWGDFLFIGTAEGVHRADPGDWIIRGVKGELYPCKPDIFAATYDAA